MQQVQGNSSVVFRFSLEGVSQHINFTELRDFNEALMCFECGFGRRLDDNNELLTFNYGSDKSL